MLDLHLLSQGASATSSVLSVTRKFRRQDRHHHQHSFNSHLLNTDYRTVTVLGARVTMMTQPSMSFPFPVDFLARLLLGSTCHHHHYYHDSLLLGQYWKLGMLLKHLGGKKHKYKDKGLKSKSVKNNHLGISLKCRFLGTFTKLGLSGSWDGSQDSTFSKQSRRLWCRHFMVHILKI